MKPQYIIKNLRISLISTPIVCWLYVLCTVISVLAVLFSHGVYQNYERKIISSDSAELDYDTGISFGNKVSGFTTHSGNKCYIGDGKGTVKEFRQLLSKLDNETKEAMGGFFVDITYTDMIKDELVFLYSRIAYDKEAMDYGLCDKYTVNIPIQYGRNISQEEMLAGENVIVLPPVYDESYLGTDYELLGKTYKVIGIESKSVKLYEFIVPFKALPDDLEYRQICFIPYKPITTKAYKRFCAAMEEVYGDRPIYPDMPTVDEEEQTFYRSIMLISLVLSAIAAITLAILFRFIIYTRRKSLAVLRLSGCTRNGARLMYITEGIGITAALFLLTTLAYNKWILPHLTVFFDRITEVYTPTTYVYIAAVFLGTLFVVLCAMVSFSVDKQPVDMLRKAGGR